MPDYYVPILEDIALTNDTDKDTAMRKLEAWKESLLEK